MNQIMITQPCGALGTLGLGDRVVTKKIRGSKQWPFLRQWHDRCTLRLLVVVYNETPVIGRNSRTHLHVFLSWLGLMIADDIQVDSDLSSIQAKAHNLFEQVTVRIYWINENIENKYYIIT